MVSMTTGDPLGPLELDGRPLSLEQINLVANGSMTTSIAPTARPRIAASQAVVERIVTSNETAYGINTGFGKLSDVRISPGDLQQLQRNLVRSHACGVGEPLEEPEVRAMLLLRANVLAKGLSGVRYQLIELLTGTHPRYLPGPLQLPRQRGPDYAAFVLTMPEHLDLRLRRQASALLSHAGISEPVTWEPPPGWAPGIPPPGRLARAVGRAGAARTRPR